MREIEFRGISVTNGKFVYGDLIHALNGKVYINIKTISGGGTEFIQPIEVIANTVGEFIGLKDRENNKIWEGDIISFPKSPIFERYEIRYSVNLVGFCLYDLVGDEEEQMFSDWQSSDMKVIGNIHEHKHLLGGANA